MASADDEGEGQWWLEQSLLQPRNLTLGPPERGHGGVSLYGHTGGLGPVWDHWAAAPREMHVAKPQVQLLLFQESSLLKKKARPVWELTFPLYLYILEVSNSLQLFHSKCWSPSVQVLCGLTTDNLHEAAAL